MGAQAEHKRWLRDKREQAYLAFLAARNGWVDVSVRKGDVQREAKREHQAQWVKFVDLESWNRLQVNAWAEVVRTAPEVDFYGTKAARDAVRAWTNDLWEIYMMSTRPAGNSSSTMREVEQIETERHRDPFLELIRRELGIADL